MNAGFLADHDSLRRGLPNDHRSAELSRIEILGILEAPVRSDPLYSRSGLTSKQLSLQTWTLKPGCSKTALSLGWQVDLNSVLWLSELLHLDPRLSTIAADLLIGL